MSSRMENQKVYIMPHHPPHVQASPRHASSTRHAHQHEMARLHDSTNVCREAHRHQPDARTTSHVSEVRKRHATASLMRPQRCSVALPAHLVRQTETTKKKNAAK